MKTKGRRQSDNIELYIADGFEPAKYDPKIGVDKSLDKYWSRWKPANETKKKTDRVRKDRVEKELDRLEKEGKTPKPSDRPRHVQVTPGKWETKEKK